MGDQEGQGQGPSNAAGMEQVTKKRSAEEDSHFVCVRGPTEPTECEKKIVWDILNIDELMKMSKADLEDKGITFEAGHSIGIPATWYFYLTPKPEDSIGGCLILKSESVAKAVKASYSVKLTCGLKTIASQNDFTPLEFKGRGWDWPLFRKSGILQETSNGRKALKITLIVKVFKDEPGPSDTATAKKLCLFRDVTSHFKQLLESGDGADVEITVPSEAGGEIDDSAYKKKAHKIILMGRSSVFSKMFANDGKMIEAQKGKVVIKDLSKKGLDVFLNYLYTGKTLKAWLQVPAEILNASEKYDCPRLKQYCGENLLSAVTTKNALELHQLAKLYNLSAAKDAIVKFIHNNTRAVLDDDEDQDISDEAVGEGEVEEEVDDA